MLSGCAPKSATTDDSKDVKVRVVDRIQEEYLEMLQEKINQALIHGMEEVGPSPLEIKEEKDRRNERKAAVKAWQARTTYELGTNDPKSRLGGMSHAL